MGHFYSHLPALHEYRAPEKKKQEASLSPPPPSPVASKREEKKQGQQPRTGRLRVFVPDSPVLGNFMLMLAAITPVGIERVPEPEQSDVCFVLCNPSTGRIEKDHEIKRFKAAAKGSRLNVLIIVRKNNDNEESYGHISLENDYLDPVIALKDVINWRVYTLDYHVTSGLYLPNESKLNAATFEKLNRDLASL